MNILIWSLSIDLFALSAFSTFQNVEQWLPIVLGARISKMLCSRTINFEKDDKAKRSIGTQKINAGEYN